MQLEDLSPIQFDDLAAAGWQAAPARQAAPVRQAAAQQAVIAANRQPATAVEQLPVAAAVAAAAVDGAGAARVLNRGPTFFRCAATVPCQTLADQVDPAQMACRVWKGLGCGH